MTSGFKIAGGTDLDEVFAPYTSGTKPSNTGFTVSGVDFKDRFQPGSALVNTGFKISGGADLKAVFAGIVKSPAEYAGKFYEKITGTGAVNGYNAFTIAANGSWSASGHDGAPPYSGDWHAVPASGVGAGYEVRFTPTTPSRGTSIVTNGASSWTDIGSDRGINLSVSADGEDAVDDAVDVLVELRTTGGILLASDTITIGVTLP